MLTSKESVDTNYCHQKRHVDGIREINWTRKSEEKWSKILSSSLLFEKKERKLGNHVVRRNVVCLVSMVCLIDDTAETQDWDQDSIGRNILRKYKFGFHYTYLSRF